MAETRRLSELVDDVLRRIELPDGPLIVAISGGADSAALAYLTLKGGRDTSALHIDHGLSASARMRAAAGSITERLGIDLRTIEVQLTAGPSPEERARVARYEAFDHVGGPLLTAHTRDDSAETMLINLIRGTGVAGLTGISVHRPPSIHRPLLDVTRAEVREIATLAGLPFEDDPMNDDLALTRNWLRYEIMPRLREVNPQIDEALARAATFLRRDAALIEGSVPVVDGEGLAVGLVATLPRPIADRLLGRLISASGVGVTADRLERAWEVVRGESERQDLAEGRSLVRHGALIVVE